MLTISDRLKKLGPIYKQLLLALLVSSSSMIYGLNSGWVSPMKKILQSTSSPTGKPLTDGELTWIATAMTITGIIAIPLHSYSADKFGRKAGLVITFTSQTLSWIVLLISSHIAALIVARICAGVGGAGAFSLVFLYIKEICQDSIRGTLVIFCSSFQFIGILAVYLMGGYFNYYTTIWICLVISAMMSVLVIFLTPETPNYLVKNGKLEEARVTLASIRQLDMDHEVIQNEINGMISEDEYFRKYGNITFITIFKNKAWRRGTILCTLMFYGVGFNGTFCMVTYAHGIIAPWGVTVSPELQTLSIPILMTVGCIVPLTCMEKTGRKPLVIGTLLLSSLALAVLATSFLIKEYGVTFPWFVPIIAMATTVCGYSMGVVGITAVILNDMFKYEIRAKLSGFVLSQAWVAMSCQVASYYAISKSMGTYSAFFIYAAVNLCNALLVVFFVPETKGKTPGEIEDLLLGKKIDQATNLNG